MQPLAVWAEYGGSFADLRRGCRIRLAAFTAFQASSRTVCSLALPPHFRYIVPDDAPCLCEGRQATPSSSIEGVEVSDCLGIMYAVCTCTKDACGSRGWIVGQLSREPRSDMERHKIWIRLSPPVEFCHQTETALMVKEQEFPVELSVERVWEGRLQQQSDIFRMSLYLGDREGDEHVLRTAFSAYDLWGLISSADHVWPSGGFLSSSDHPKNATMEILLSGACFWSDLRRPRLFAYATQSGTSCDTVRLTEKLLSGHVDLYLQGYEPYPSGVRVPHDFIVCATLTRGLQTGKGTTIAPGEGLWFRVPFRALAWRHMQRPAQDASGIPWEPVTTPMLLKFERTGRKVDAVNGIYVQQHLTRAE
jgi:hypothetical protein